jgi:predicted HD phosphohydrolase
MTKRLVDPDALARCHRRYACEAGVSPACNGRVQQAHHRKLRKQGGPDTDDNLLAVCNPCHDHIHANPKESYMNGTLIPSWADITPFEP